MPSCTDGTAKQYLCIHHSNARACAACQSTRWHYALRHPGLQSEDLKFQIAAASAKPAEQQRNGIISIVHACRCCMHITKIIPRHVQRHQKQLCCKSTLTQLPHLTTNYSDDREEWKQEKGLQEVHFLALPLPGSEADFAGSDC